MTDRLRHLVVLMVLDVLASVAFVGSGGGVSASVAHPTVDDESGFWPFDGDTSTATDYGGFGQHASLHVPAAFTTTSLPALDVGNSDALTLPSGGYATAPVASSLATSSQITIA